MYKFAENNFSTAKKPKKMLKTGEKQVLRIGRFSPNGAYLTDEEGNEVLLPNRYLTPEMKEGSDTEVFIHTDSEDRPVASTDMPYVMQGEVALLQVVDTTPAGAFLDWGLPKDLFLPLSNQKRKLRTGDFCLVTIYTDKLTGRIVATTRLNALVNNEEIAVEPREKVDIIVAERNDLGYRVIINNRNWGMIYDNQIFISDIRIGDILTGYIARITPDRRIDVLLQPIGGEQMQDAAGDLFALLKEQGGSLPIGDKSSPEEVYRIAQMSKKMFKKGIGKLWKEGTIEMSDFEIKLK